ncbi:MAG: hypothetical protein BM557_11035 [Flavobacterium sp. MedPE-SWcel]|uniref:hypothetical protein n=1 Tax=uncultured Flavobacterium sp. TaxID=165435 RepID=UPI00091625D9|nr:hypothetical protein [uncultured Flavobacterium sp.]OIQ15825.1 MAG: hypothetical protein BM557_11035 [Flavobacterium sp. MedPE-SWcel]
MEASVGTILITFHVNVRLDDVVGGMEKKGYMDRWGELSSNRVHLLPRTSLWHNFKSTDAALLDLRNVCTSMNILIESAVAVEAAGFKSF